MGRIEKSIEVNAPVSTCYAIWTDFENFPRFMHNVKEVSLKGDGRSLGWVVKGPLGRDVSWDAEITGMQQDQSVSWKSVHNSEVDNAGAVTFEALDNNRTRVNVVISYDPPAGVAGEFIADIFSNPSGMVQEDLEHFQELVEQPSVGVGVPAKPANLGLDNSDGFTQPRTTDLM